MADIYLNVTYPEGKCDVVTVEEGKYGFVIHEDHLVHLLRHGEIWEDTPIPFIKYNRAFGAMAVELRDLLKARLDDLK